MQAYPHVLDGYTRPQLRAIGELDEPTGPLSVADLATTMDNTDLRGRALTEIAVGSRYRRIRQHNQHHTRPPDTDLRGKTHSH